MNWTQFKDPVSHVCLGGYVVTQEVAGLKPFTVMTNSANSLKSFRKNSIVQIETSPLHRNA